MFLVKTPVIIPARNEEAYIGRTLRSLPPDLTEPIVAINGSSDRTAEIAENFGAHVIEFEEPGKLPALQATLKSMGTRALSPLLILDADTYPLRPRRWHNSMLGLLHRNEEREPAAVGGGIWFRGGDIATSIFHSSWLVYQGVKRGLTHDTSTGQTGPNLGIKIRQSDALDAILALPHLWPGEDRAIVDILRKHEGQYFHTISPNTYAITRIHAGLPSARQRMSMTGSESAEHTHAYYIDNAAPGSVPYGN